MNNCKVNKMLLHWLIKLKNLIRHIERNNITVTSTINSLIFEKVLNLENKTLVGRCTFFFSYTENSKDMIIIMSNQLKYYYHKFWITIILRKLIEYNL